MVVTILLMYVLLLLLLLFVFLFVFVLFTLQINDSNNSLVPLKFSYSPHKNMDMYLLNITLYSFENSDWLPHPVDIFP